MAHPDDHSNPSPESSGTGAVVRAEAVDQSELAAQILSGRPVAEPDELLQKALADAAFFHQQARSPSSYQLLADTFHRVAQTTDPDTTAFLELLLDEYRKVLERMFHLEKKVQMTSTAGTSQPAQAITQSQVAGGRVSFVSLQSVSIGTAGERSQARDSEDLLTIIWDGVLAADITLSGAGGLDTGVEAASTWYAIHVIGDSNAANDPAALLSTSATAPVLPAGYNRFRRLGWVRNNSTSNFRPFIQIGSGRQRTYWWDDEQATLNVLTGGSATVFTTVSCASLMPPTSREVKLRMLFTNATAFDAFVLKPGGSTVGIPVWGALYGVLVFPFMTQETRMPTDSSQQIEYLVTNALDSLDIKIQGYEDEL